ncbi:MAG: HNH endonuclease [Acidobacteria bacterium]|nr:HNH endonuclease [Acidobacteriota bacterium]MCL5286498.1 HNH endonuclease [Acidobacteriota bacterium]MCL5287781.1 HNH endonuclease [Acidobacteriota bacterium]
MSAHSTAARLWMAVEDRLIPALRLTTHERAIYYHLLRRTRLVGRRMLRISRRQMACVSGLSTYTARQYFRLLARKQCIRFVDRGAAGCLLSVFLPDEILPRLPAGILADSASSGQLASLARRSPIALDAAGQPRAWPRTDHFRNENFRARILHRDCHRCFYCRRALHLGKWTLDHVVPIVRGGLDTASNLVACCVHCNWEKSFTPAAEFLKSLARKKILTPSRLRSRLHALRSLASAP